jgi:hypothetical protein
MMMMMMMKSSFPSHECTNGSATVCALVQTCVGILIPGFKTRIRWCFVPPCAETENSVMANVEWQSEVVRSDLHDSSLGVPLIQRTKLIQQDTVFSSVRFIEVNFGPLCIKVLACVEAYIDLL